MSDVVVLIDREQGGRARLASQGLQLHSAFTLRWGWAGAGAPSGLLLPGCTCAHCCRNGDACSCCLTWHPSMLVARLQSHHLLILALSACSYILDTLLRHGLVTDDVAAKVRAGAGALAM